MPSIHSPNFSLTGGIGWSINEDGTATFFNVQAYGDIFVYSPVPGPNDLVVALAGLPGVDQFGNKFYEGITINDNAGGTILARPDLGPTILIYSN